MKRSQSGEPDIEKLKMHREESLLSAVNKLSEKKTPDAEKCFCGFLCAQMKKMTPSQQARAYQACFSAIQDILSDDSR